MLGSRSSRTILHPRTRGMGGGARDSKQLVIVSPIIACIPKNPVFNRSETDALDRHLFVSPGEHLIRIYPFALRTFSRALSNRHLSTRADETNGPTNIRPQSGHLIPKRRCRAHPTTPEIPERVRRRRKIQRRCPAFSSLGKGAHPIRTSSVR